MQMNSEQPPAPSAPPATSRQVIQGMLDEMRPFAVAWAKMSESSFQKRAKKLDEQTPEQLAQTYQVLTGIYTGSFARLMKVWKRLPEQQWVVTFALGMHHLDEYKDLRAALLEFRKEYIGAKS